MEAGRWSPFLSAWRLVPSLRRNRLDFLWRHAIAVHFFVTFMAQAQQVALVGMRRWVAIHRLERKVWPDLEVIDMVHSVGASVPVVLGLAELAFEVVSLQDFPPQFPPLGAGVECGDVMQCAPGSPGFLFSCHGLESLSSLKARAR